MANKLDRIEKDIEKTKAKIAELQKQLRELEAAKTEQENLQIIQLVRGLNMKPEEFAAFLRGGALQTAPAPQPDFEQEDNAHEEYEHSRVYRDTGRRALPDGLFHPRVCRWH